MNNFSEKNVLERIRNKILESNFFKDVKIGRVNKTYFQLGLIGNKNINKNSNHYEIIKRNDKIYLEFHFEGEKYKSADKYIKLSPKYEWFEWYRGKSIRCKESFNANEFNIDDLIDKLMSMYKDLNNEIEKYINYITLENNSFKMSKIKDISKKLLENKKQIILYGPPGTGKTFSVKEIIENHSGEKIEDLKQDGKVKFITFHQSFSYEEFIEGIKAETDEDGNISYEIKSGIFKEIVEKAKENFENSKNGKKISMGNVEYFFHTGYEIGKNYKIIKKTDEILYIERIKDNSVIPLPIYILNELLKLISNGEILIKDLKDSKIKRVNKYIEPYLINGYNNLYYFLVKDFLNKNGENYDLIQEELKNYYLIIDEINRGNISKIFGELITLLEADKRIGEKNEITTILPYSKKVFSIPPNLYIIATMNTSDKSIVSLDTALRRRFGFIEVLPDYEILDKNIEGINLGQLLEKLNERIEFLLDKDHLIGHSYFLKVENLEDLKLVFYNEIIPLLEEYFFGEEEKIVKVLGSGFFERKKFDEKLFEDGEGFEEEKFELKDLNDEEFLKVLESIL